MTSFAPKKICEFTFKLSQAAGGSTKLPNTKHSDKSQCGTTLNSTIHNAVYIHTHYIFMNTEYNSMERRS